MLTQVIKPMNRYTFSFRCLLCAVMLSNLIGCTTKTVSEAFEDTRNASLAKKLIKNSHKRFGDANFEVTSFKGIILITGQVPSAEMIPIATTEVESLRNVRKVYNELVMAGSTSMLSRTNDSWLTTKVKSALAAKEETDATRIKIVTENGVVFMMGLLSQEEADAAVKTAREIQGVQKIVKIFEYIN